jgi:hypothetical protein
MLCSGLGGAGTAAAENRASGSETTGALCVMSGLGGAGTAAAEYRAGGSEAAGA